MFIKAACIVLLVLFIVDKANCDSSLSVDKHDIKLKLKENTTVNIILGSDYEPVNDTLNIIIQHTDIAAINITSLDLNVLNENYSLNVQAIGAGKTDIYSNTTYNRTNVDDVYFRITVYKAAALDTLSTVIGWIYFAAWSISFYPQVYINWKRKSVIGLNFDFLSLNIVGFLLYSVFNLGLYYIPEVKEEYSARYPRGLNPVQVNDIFFAVHAVILTCFTLFQCCVYDRGEQRVSITARIILAIFGVFIGISAIIAGCAVIHWLDFLYYCSYVKLTITLIKYIPQAYMNYKRKSTVGWSIGNILLDFTGGMLSVLQMILNAYNYDDWQSIFGDPTKFGLGVFSVAFDVFFMFQHYLFYKDSRYEDKC
ncbi:cystinosin homolog [Anthonomus grandis grandis]|uniref:cystinosin homolog n=1 Tax=Anthonomus grandis grandis TaxID=2921223 RepID=UPI0021657371|nr:cystinosin homolog [Anthonomus grandis grandis]XP_050293074.1 cystinosin homolog [Anthonomus grandis grandis]